MGPSKSLTLTPAQYTAHLHKLGLTPYAAGPELGISRRQSIRYAQGDSDIPEIVEKLVTALVQLQKADVGQRPREALGRIRAW